MEPARSIGKLGFRRWYERQLIEGHAWLVTALLCALGIAASLEGLSFRNPPFEILFTLAFVFAAGLICWHALQRYRRLMDEAEYFADRSTCAGCRTYGIFSVVGESPRMSVRCRKCGHEWLLK